jgi:hypothetical protein
MLNIDLKKLIPQIHITQRDLDSFIDPASRARVGAAAAQITGAAAVQQQIDRSTNIAVYAAVGIVGAVLLVWYVTRR